MLIQLYRDNYTTTPIERLNFTLYNGYFNGTDANANLSFFETAEVLATGSTTNLSSLATASSNTFQENYNETQAMNDFWTNSNYTYTASNLTITTRTTGYLRLTMNNSTDPTLTLAGTSRPSVNPNNFKYIHIRYKVVSGTADRLEFLYYSTTVPIGGNKFVGVDYENVQLGVWKNLVIDMTNNNDWISSSSWNRFRLDPITSGTAVIDFEYLVISNSIQPPDFNSKSLKISGFYRAKKTGVYRFFTRSDDASFLAIEDAIIVFNGGTHAGQNKFGNINMVAGRYYKIDFYYGESSVGQEFSAGYLEPLDNGTTSGSTNLNDFIRNATGLTTYYDINPETQPALTTGDFPLVIEDGTLQGLFRVSPLAVYINRTNFTGGKHSILYIASDDLFNNFNGTYKNYIQIHEKPVANDIERKRFTQFSSDMSFECDLNGRIEVRFRRGSNEPTAWRYAMLILDVERIPTKYL